jgi:hypothetical protein
MMSMPVTPMMMLVLFMFVFAMLAVFMFPFPFHKNGTRPNMPWRRHIDRRRRNIDRPRLDIYRLRRVDAGDMDIDINIDPRHGMVGKHHGSGNCRQHHSDTRFLIHYSSP